MPDATDPSRVLTQVGASIGAELGRLLGGGAWAVSPLGGSTGRALLATGPGTAVVRVGASLDVATRLDALGVGPRVLAAGTANGRPFVVQEHLLGDTATREWLANHAAEVARLVAQYANDPILRNLAEPLVPAGWVRELSDRAARLDLWDAHRDTLARIVSTASDMSDGSLVASHGDPNGSNFVVADDRLVLVDWDDLRRADPLRDLGQLAWWYLPRSAWPGFVSTAGHRWDAAVEERLFWWVAAESLDVALRLLPDHPDVAMDFLADAGAAAARTENPRRVP